MSNKLTFGEALEALKKGSSVSREGWNGKNMFIHLNKGNLHSVPQSSLTEMEKNLDDKLLIEGVPSFLFDSGPEGSVTRLPNINMRAATGSTVTGWLASQTDILAEDWGIVEP